MSGPAASCAVTRESILWRRLLDRANGRIEAAGARSISTGETVAFGADIIHSVVNPIPRATGALHVYGGDLFGTERSEGDPDSLAKRAYDTDKVRRMFKR